MKDTIFAYIAFSNFSSFIFKMNHVFIEKDNLRENIIIVEEELDDVDIDGIGNSEGLPQNKID